MKEVKVGLIGAGFISNHHCKSLLQVTGVSVKLGSVSDVFADKAAEIAEKYGFEKSTADYRDILADPEIDIVDICTPPFLHKKMVEEAMLAGKHVICEKPLTGYFGAEGDEKPIGDRVPKSKMYEAVLKELEELEAVISASGKRFMYAENYIYSPNLLKAAELINAKKSRILLMRGEESLRGTSSPVAGFWDKTGGGCLIRGGTHPLSGLLWLKQVEAQARGADISVKSVMADTGRVTPTLTEDEHRHILIRPQDVEDIATVVISFSDGSKAVVMTGDVCLGCVKNEIVVYANDATFHCRITPNDNLETYFLDEKGIEDCYLAEMLPNKLGWQKAFISEQVQRGYIGEMQDFVECAVFDREPLSGFKLAKDTAKVLYAAYLSAEEGRRVEL